MADLNLEEHRYLCSGFLYFTEKGDRIRERKQAAHHSPTGRLIGLGSKQSRFVVLLVSLRLTTSSAFHSPWTAWQ